MKPESPVSVRSVSDLIIGFQYKVNAPGAGKTEWWTIQEVTDNDEVIAKGERTAYPRTFRRDQIGEMKPVKKIMSESVELVCEINGQEMWVERIDYWPAQERRGRKPMVAA